MTQTNEAIPAASEPGRRRPEDIEREISDIRARMDAAIDEIEFRLSPGQMSGGVVDLLRAVVSGEGEGTAGRIARAMRANPVPVALIGIGALWLGWAVARMPVGATAEAVETTFGAGDGWLSDARLRRRLAGLAAACRRGAVGFRRVDPVIGDRAMSGRLAQVGDQLDRSARALDAALADLGGGDPEAEASAVWDELDAALAGALDGSRTRAAVLAALEAGLDHTLALFRDTLGETLPESLQVTLGSEFHAIETVRHRVGALREAMA